MISMLEELEGSGALERLANSVPQLAERLGVVEELLHSVERSVAIHRQAPAAGGGISGLWQMLRDPDSQETLRFLLTVGKELRTGLTK